MKIIAFVSLIVLTSCSSEPVQTTEAESIPELVQETSSPKQDFELSMSLNEGSANEFELVTNIALDSGAYIISPYSEDTFYLKFNMTLPENEETKILGKLNEQPSSIEQFDPIIEQAVRFVRKNTSYKQAFKVISMEDFELTGKLEFLVEPSCIPYDCEFTLSKI